MMILRPGKPEMLKKHNRELVLSIIETEGEVSRAVLEKQSQLSRTTISGIINELLDIGLICETGHDSSTGGRRPERLGLNNSQWHAIGVEMLDTEWNVAVVNLSGHVVHSQKLPISDPTPTSAIRVLIEGLKQTRLNHKRRLLPAVGVGVPGLVDLRTDTIISADHVDYLRWSGICLTERTNLELGIPAYLINRHRAGSLAEARYGVGKGISELVYIGIGKGISAAIFTKGALIEGANSSAGEVGHMVVDPDGLICPCGNQGCLQIMASGDAMLRYVYEHGAQDGKLALGSHTRELAEVTANDIIRAAIEGDRLSLACINESARFLGIAISNLVNTLNPSMVIIGGPVGLTGGLYLDLIKAEVKKRAMRYPLSTLHIVTGTIGLNAGAIGAATRVLDRKLDLLFP